jgi:putative transposase
MSEVSVIDQGYNVRVQILQAYRYELRPTNVQSGAMLRFAGSSRYVYNRGLALQRERYAGGEKNLGYAGLCRELTTWRSTAETAWLAEAPVHALQQALKDLDRA